MLFTFPSRYWFTIGLTGVFSLAGWSRRIRAEFLVLRVTQVPATAVRTSRTGPSPSTAALSRGVPVVLSVRCRGPYYTGGALPRRRFGLFPGRSPLLGESLIYFLFLQVLRCFSSLRSPYRLAVMAVLQTAGLSHSEISGSMPICSYPKLIAAYHVLHRLREPRHPPCALLYFLFDPPAAWMSPGGQHARRPLILSAVSFSWIRDLKSLVPDSLESDSLLLQFCLCQYVKDLLPWCTLQNA